MFAALIPLAACVSAQPDALKDYPDGFLCQLLDPNQYITTPQEQIDIHRELENRDVACSSGGASINQTVVINN
ncbi:hypothetical protein [Yoonia maritima]|uniref:hypothetical protein n=1 Tax=Yoonia maritima TaxID=1435347 RepID=UPI003736492F